MKNKNLLIGAGVLIVVYLLFKKSKTNSVIKNDIIKTQYSNECLNRLQNRKMQKDVKPANFEKDFLENCEKSKNQTQKYSLGMPQLKPRTIEEERAFAIIYYKTLPDSFTIDNVNYTKNSNLEFYKTPFSISGDSGVPPIKISGADFNNAYIKFRDKDLPKSPFELKFGSYKEPYLKI